MAVSCFGLYTSWGENENLQLQLKSATGWVETLTKLDE